MFYWICPECGGEIPPTAKECPVCDSSGETNGAPPASSPASASAAPVVKEIPVARPAVLRAIDILPPVRSLIERTISEPLSAMPTTAKIIDIAAVSAPQADAPSLQPAGLLTRASVQAAVTALLERPKGTIQPEAVAINIETPSSNATPLIELLAEIHPEAAEQPKIKTSPANVEASVTEPPAEAARPEVIAEPEIETPVAEAVPAMVDQSTETVQPEAVAPSEVEAPLALAAAPVTEPPTEAARPEVVAEPEIETPVANVVPAMVEQPTEVIPLEAAAGASEIDIVVAIAAEPTAATAVQTEMPEPAVIETAAIPSVAPEPVHTLAPVPPEPPAVAAPVAAEEIREAPQDPLLALAEQIRSAQFQHAAAQAAMFEPEPPSQPVPEPASEGVPAIDPAPSVEANEVQPNHLKPREPAPVQTAALPEPPHDAAPQLSGLARLVAATGLVEMVSSAGLVERASGSGSADVRQSVPAGLPYSESPSPRPEDASPEPASRRPLAPESPDHGSVLPISGTQILATTLHTAAEELLQSLTLSHAEQKSAPANSSVALLEPPPSAPSAGAFLPPPAPQVPPPPPVRSMDAPASEATEIAALAEFADSPPSGSRLALAPLQSYKAAARRAMHPAMPDGKILTQGQDPKITLPGPALPPDLVSIQNSGAAAALEQAKRAKKGKGTPGWLVSFSVMLALLLLGVVAVAYLLPGQHSNAVASKLPVETPAPEPVVPNAARPLAQYVEVTGFRIVVDPAKKSEIHYLVVNHSAAAISNLTVYVTLRSAGAKPGQPPVSRFSFRAPELEPFESKEMTSPIEKVTRAANVPDWSDLRADVQVTQ